MLLAGKTYYDRRHSIDVTVFIALSWLIIDFKASWPAQRCPLVPNLADWSWFKGSLPVKTHTDDSIGTLENVCHCPLKGQKSFKTFFMLCCPCSPQTLLGFPACMGAGGRLPPSQAYPQSDWGCLETPKMSLAQTHRRGAATWSLAGSIDIQSWEMKCPR